MEKLFYSNLKEFLKDLISVFPEDDELKIITSSINIAMVDDPEYEIIKEFYITLNPFEQLIHTKNVYFFEVNTVHSKKGSNQFKFFTKLNSVWNEIDNINKDKVWDYLTVVYGLSKNICS